LGERIKPIEFTSRAIKDLQKVKSFNLKLYGKTKTEAIINSIFHHIEVLENPNNNFIDIGAIDETFKDLRWKYRKLIEDHYKITYREGKTKIYV
jgi:hypothetical protein